MAHPVFRQIRTLWPPGRRTPQFALCCLVVAVASVESGAVLAAAPAAKIAEETPFPGSATVGYRWARGWIVRIVASEVVVDLGAADGLRVGQELAMYRTVKARHPRTGKEVADRFNAGLTTVQELATHLAILRPDKDLLTLLAEGDLVECQVPAPQAAATVAKADAKKPAKSDSIPTKTTGEQADCPPSRQCPACPPSGSAGAPSVALSADEAALDESFRNSLGRTPHERITLWQDWLRRFPASAHRASVQLEIDALQEQVNNARTARADGDRITKLRAFSQRIHHDRPHLQRVGEAVWLAFAAADWSDVADLRVHVRPLGKTTYTMVRPEPSGRLHRRLRIGTELVAEKGFQYFVEMSQISDGKSFDIVGNPREPVVVVVNDPFAEVGRRPVDSSTFRIVGEFVDFNRGRGDDQFLFSEISIAYRLQNPQMLYGFEMGYGLLTGVGGLVAAGPSLDIDGKPHFHQNGPKLGQPIAKDDTVAPRGAAFKYGYMQTEWALAAQFHAITRLVVGLGKDGIDNGIELMGRIGPERGTNLRLGVATMADTGRAASIALTTHAIETVPITGLFEVTNRPVGEDIGVRLVAQADYKINKHFGLTGRIGYNLRTIVHAGASAGAGMVMSW